MIRQTKKGVILTGKDAAILQRVSKATGVPPKWIFIALMVNKILKEHGYGTSGPQISQKAKS